MDTVTVDPSLLGTLEKLDRGVRLCDPAGRTVGYFVPATESERELYAWAQAQFSDAELDSAAAEPGGRTTDEVLARLGTPCTTRDPVA